MTDPEVRIDTVYPPRAGIAEVSPRHDIELHVNLLADQRVVLDKEYGPLIFTSLRITPSFQTCEWIVERQRIDSMEWIEVARIPGQMDCEYDESDPNHRTIEQAEAEGTLG